MNSNSPAPPRGAFIVFEGVDRSGKTTQTTRLVDSLQAKGHKVELWRYPDRTTTIGQMINGYLSNTADLNDNVIHLLFSANRWEKRDALIDKLASGVTIIADRYAFSGVAFSVAKQQPELSLAWCKAPDEGLPAPDAVLFLDVDPVVAATRGGYGGERYEQPEMQKRVRSAFLNLVDRDTWHVLDASRSVDEVAKDVHGVVEGVVAACGKGKRLDTLWGEDKGDPVYE